MRIDGLQGGHSGVDIHRKLGNSIKIMAGALEAIKQKTNIHLAELKGGSRLNTIPAQSQAIITFTPGYQDTIRKSINDYEKMSRLEYALETGLTITFSALDQKEKPVLAFSVEDTNRIISMLLNLPNGVATMDPLFPGNVETSNNLGTVNTSSEGLKLMSFQRSSNPSRLDEFSSKIRMIAWKYGAESNDVSRFDPWQPDTASDLLKRAQKVYQQVFKRPAGVAVIHGGLECGLIALRVPGLDMIAVGPTIQSPHSPHEKLLIPTVAKVRTPYLLEDELTP